jgi:hypothetical protein
MVRNGEQVLERANSATELPPSDTRVALLKSSKPSNIPDLQSEPQVKDETLGRLYSLTGAGS